MVASNDRRNRLDPVPRISRQMVAFGLRRPSIPRWDTAKNRCNDVHTLGYYIVVKFSMPSKFPRIHDKIDIRVTRTRSHLKRGTGTRLKKLKCRLVLNLMNKKSLENTMEKANKTLIIFVRDGIPFRRGL